MAPRVRQSSLAQAAALAQGAGCVAFGGWSLSRRPIAVAARLIEANVQFDELLVLTGGLETDLLLAAGSIGRVRTFYLGLESLGPGPGLKGPAEVLEETESSLILGLRAAVGHQSSIPLPGDQCEALLTLRPELERHRCPYSGQTQVLLPALRPDLCFVHAAKADRSGRVSWCGNHAADVLLSRASRHTVVTCEQLVDRLDPADDPVALNPLEVDTLVHCPRGAWPTACLPDYAADWSALLEYVALERAAVRGWVARGPAAWQAA